VPDDEQPPTPPSSPTERPRYRQLNGWERVGAVAAATVVGTVGFVAMFKTGNEGGVAVAILLAGVLLVIAIQGTQIGKLGGKDIGAEMALREEDRREIAQRTKAIAEENPAEAQAMLEGYQVADPDSMNAPEILRASTFIYEQQLLQELDECGPDLHQLGVVRIHLGRDYPSSPDAVLEFEDVRIGIDLGRNRPWMRMPVGTTRQHLWDRATHYKLNALLLLSPANRVNSDRITTSGLVRPVLAIYRWLPEFGQSLVEILQELLPAAREHKKKGKPDLEELANVAAGHDPDALLADPEGR
jgi:hypothetical protein